MNVYMYNVCVCMYLFMNISVGICVYICMYE